MSNKITDDDKKQKRIVYLGDDKKHDIHERDKKHLSDTLKSYIKVSNKFPKEFKIIECVENGDMLPIDVIHKKVIKIIEKHK